mmetsp:Transcript_57516/g.178723  ORF Transcript_57516/g.178723 Transcript_57516/m.178723 type:complete len:302 (+) Transcript_57516:599-1504(+)
MQHFVEKPRDHFLVSSRCAVQRAHEVNEPLVCRLGGLQEQHAGAGARRLPAHLGRGPEPALQRVHGPREHRAAAHQEAQPGAAVPVVLLRPGAGLPEEPVHAAGQDGVGVHPDEALELRKPPDLQLQELETTGGRRPLCAGHGPGLAQQRLGHRHWQHRQRLHAQATKALRGVRAVGEAAGVREHHQRVGAQLPQGAGHGQHVPEARLRSSWRIECHHHEGAAAAPLRVERPRRDPSRPAVRPAARLQRLVPVPVHVPTARGRAPEQEDASDQRGHLVRHAPAKSTPSMRERSPCGLRNCI